MKKWRAAFRRPHRDWDGAKAVAELRAARYLDRTPKPGEGPLTMLDFVSGNVEGDWRPQQLFTFVLSEIRAYKKLKGRWQKEFQNAELCLAKVELEVAQIQKKAQSEDVVELLAEVRVAADRSRKAIRGLGKSPLGSFEGLWPNHPRPERIVRALDGDSVLQIQLAKAFRTFIPESDVSLRTIAGWSFSFISSPALRRSQEKGRTRRSVANQRLDAFYFVAFG